MLETLAVVARPRLGDSLSTRNNNFTVVRVALAMAVLFTHSYALTGSGADPFTAVRGFLPSLGELAVYGFFAVSGFLVAASVERRSVVSFLLARAARVYPAVVVCTLITVLVVGPLFTTLPFSEYFSHPATSSYLWNAMLWQIQFTLPGIFETNAYPASVNGSLWTLPAEIRCYLLLAIAGFFGALSTRARANTLLIGLLFAGCFAYSNIPLFGLSPGFAPLAGYFAVGVLAWVNRGSIPQTGLLTAAAVGALAVALWLPVPPPVVAVAWVYLLLFLAERTPNTGFDTYGDPSYGIYVYAFLVQQMIWAPGQTAWLNFIVAVPLTIAAGYASWWIVERPTIDFAKRYLTLAGSSNSQTRSTAIG